MPAQPLALVLLRASRWFDGQLLDGLEQRGWPRLTPAQSLVFAELAPDGISPAGLARQLGTSRQATHELLAGLVALDLLALAPDPTRRGGRLVLLTTAGQALAGDARRILHELELSVGAERARALRALLTGLDAVDQPDGGS